MTRYRFFLAISLCLAQKTFGSNESVLVEVDRYLNNPSFETSFHHQEVGTFKRRSCIASTVCDEFSTLVSVAVVDPNTVEIISQPGDPYESRQKLTRSQWETNHGNRLRFQLAAMASYGITAELDSPKQTNCEYQIGGDKLQDTCLDLEMKIGNNIGQKGTLRVYLNKNVGGLGQILFISEKMVGVEETTFLKLQPRPYQIQPCKVLHSLCRSGFSCWN